MKWRFSFKFFQHRISEHFPGQNTSEHVHTTSWERTTYLQGTYNICGSTYFGLDIGKGWYSSFNYFALVITDCRRTSLKWCRPMIAAGNHLRCLLIFNKKIYLHLDRIQKKTVFRIFLEITETVIKIKKKTFDNLNQNFARISKVHKNILSN